MLTNIRKMTIYVCFFVLLLSIQGCDIIDIDLAEYVDKDKDEDEEIEVEEMTIKIDNSRQPVIDRYGIAYPRLGMWWLDPYEESAEAIARYDLLLNEMDDPELWGKLEEVREINEDIILLRPLSPSEQMVYFDFDLDQPNPIITDLPTDFFMMYQGTSLSDNISKRDRWVEVRDLFDDDGNPLFYEGDDVAIGSYESATILEIDYDNEAIKLDRGYGRDAMSHDKGAGIRAHVRFWPGTWVMNVTSACPQLLVDGVDYPVDYITYYHLITQDMVTGVEAAYDYDYMVIDQDAVKYDGFVIDRFEDSQSWLSWEEDDYRAIDPYLTNDPVKVSEFDLMVQETVDQYTTLLRETFDVDIIIRNNPTTVRHEIHEGQVYESFGWDDLSDSFWQDLFGAEQDVVDYYGYDRLTYLGWSSVKDNPLLLMEVYDDESVPDDDGDGSYDNPLDDRDFEANEQRFRLSFTSTLLGDGFYSYEVNTNGHGVLGLMWFDAYDLGKDQKGYLGYPLGAYEEVDDQVYVRTFEYGVVVVNVSDEIIEPRFNIAVETVRGFDGDEIQPLDGCIYLYSED